MKDSMHSVANILKLVGENERLRQKRNAMTDIVRAMDSKDPNALKKAISVAANYQNQYDTGLSGILQQLAATQSTPSAPGVEALAQVGVPLAQAQSGIEVQQANAAFQRGEGRETYRSDPELKMRNLQYGLSSLRNDYADDPEGLVADPQYEWYTTQMEQLRNATLQPQGGTQGGTSVQAGYLGGKMNPSFNGQPAQLPPPETGQINQTATVQPALPPSGNPRGLPPSDMRTGAAIDDGQGKGKVRAGFPGITQTATNPQTGEKMGWNGKQWVPLQ
jgi:hypothetical protein